MDKQTRALCIRDWPRIEKPRERLIRYGPGKLSNTELLAILLRSGRKGENVIVFAGRLLKHYTAEKLPHLSYAELKNCCGLGPAKACEIIACFELGKRLLNGKRERLYLEPAEVWRALQDIRDNKKEHFVVFYLDSHNQEIKREVISMGTLNSSLVHPREVFEPAVKHLAAQVILAHNHPSGNLEPSEDDLTIHKRLAEAGKILGIEVMDHIIVTKQGYCSFKEKGLF